MPKRKGYPTRYDRKQDAQIRRLERNITLKQHVVIFSPVVLVDDVIQEFPLNLIPQGETDLTREGAEAQLQSISIRWSLHASPVATIGGGVVRLILLIDKDPRGALPAPGDVLTSQHYLSSYNTGRVLGQERNRGRFKMLYDETIILVNRPIASADALPQMSVGKIFAKLGGLSTMYTGDSGVITEVEDNSLILLALCGETVVNCTLHINAVCRFTGPD